MNFKHVYIFLVLSGIIYWKFILNINNEHAQDYSCPGQPLHLVHMDKCHLGKASYLVLYNGSRSCPAARKNSCEQLQTSEAKLTPGSVSCPEAMSCPGIM